MGRRVGGGVVAVLLLTATLGGIAGASDPVTGVGHGIGGVDMLGLTIGDTTDAVPNFVDVKIGGENSSASIDPADGVARALEQLHALSVSSAAPDPVGAALRGLSLPPVETNTTGSEQTNNNAVFDFDTFAGGTSGLLSGRVNPATLRSIVDATGAQSAMTAKLFNLGLLGGLVSAKSATASLGSSGLTTSSQSVRAATIDSVTVLNLESLTELLGFTVNDLSLDQLVLLIENLDLEQQVADLVGVDLTELGQIFQLIHMYQGLLDIDPNFCSGVEPVLGDLSALFGIGPIGCGDVPLLICLFNLYRYYVIDPELPPVIDLLKGTALLKIDGIDASTTAIARDTVASSVADVTATIGKITVGNSDLGGIPANATAQMLSDLTSATTTKLNSVLADIDPALGNLISVDLLHETTGITLAGRTVTSTANLVAATVTITPPDLCPVLGGLGLLDAQLERVGGAALLDLPESPVDPIVTTLLDGLGLGLSCPGQLPDIPVWGWSQAAGVPAVPPAVQAAFINPIPLADVAVSAVTQPVTVKAMDIGNVATFKTPAPAAPAVAASETASLPRTGASTVLLSLFAAMAAVVALGLRRVLRTASARM